MNSSKNSLDEKLEHLEQLNSQKVNLQNNIQVWEDEKLNLTVQMEELKNNHEKENLKRKWNVQKWKKQTIKDSIQSLQSNNEELKKRSRKHEEEKVKISFKKKKKINSSFKSDLESLKKQLDPLNFDKKIEKQIT